MPLWFWILIGVVIAMALLALVARRLATGRVRELATRVGRLSWRNRAAFARGLLTDRGVPMWARAIVPLLILYLALPLDIIPDFIPVIGQLDDLAVILIAGALLLRAIPRALLEEQLSRVEAQQASDARLLTSEN